MPRLEVSAEMQEVLAMNPEVLGELGLWIDFRGTIRSNQEAYTWISYDGQTARAWIRDPDLYSCDGCSIRGLEPHFIEDDEGRRFCSDSCRRDYQRQNQESLNSYNDTNPHMDTCSSKYPYRFGIEVEKEDADWRPRINSYARQREWIAVHDGSLCDEDGFELVSPCYNFRRFDEVKEIIQDMEAIDARTTKHCGGHVTVSKNGLSGEQFIEEWIDFVPLLYALYPRRLRIHWCTPMKKDGHRYDNGKYRAFNVSHDRVEIRIFPRILHRQQLIRRLELVEWGIKVDDRKEVMTELNDKSSWIRNYMSNYYTEDRIKDKIDLYAAYKEWHDHDRITQKTYDVCTAVAGLSMSTRDVVSEDRLSNYAI